MASKEITEKDRYCISGCIFKYWGSERVSGDAEERNKQYETCLDECRICA